MHLSVAVFSPPSLLALLSSMWKWLATARPVTLTQCFNFFFSSNSVLLFVSILLLVSILHMEMASNAACDFQTNAFSILFCLAPLHIWIFFFFIMQEAYTSGG